MNSDEIIEISKISTGVPGFDDLFYGGLRLPGWKDNGKGRDGICIVIYGDRGISKSDLAMQVMRGVDDYFGKLYGPDKMTPRFCTLNHRETELRKKYIGLEVGRMINQIKLPEIGNECEQRCSLCECFPNMRDKVGGVVLQPSLRVCGSNEIARCQICKLIRHEVINYSDRSQSIHWTYGEISDASNLLDGLNADVFDTKGIFDERENDVDSSNYSSIAYQRFKHFQKEITSKSEQLAQDNAQRDDNNPDFAWSSYVIEGFTAFSTDELERLPFSDLILKMRKVAAVSILVLDDRGKGLRLNADIIIHMQYKTDPDSQYTYYELQIDKSDLQQHVHGWHKYRKLRDLSVKIYPSMHSLLTRRFASDNAVLHLERDTLRYPQSLLGRFQNDCARQEGQPLEYADKSIQRVMLENGAQSMVYDERNTCYRLESIDKQCYSDFLGDVVKEAEKDDTTLVFFLLGITEQKFRSRIRNCEIQPYALRNIHLWESNLGCIWAEEYASIFKEYISRWKTYSKHKHLHIVIDDIANLNLYPLMNREELFLPVLINLCKNATDCQGYEGNRRGISITLSVVCTDSDIPQNRIIRQLVENQ